MKDFFGIAYWELFCVLGSNFDTSMVYDEATTEDTLRRIGVVGSSR